jgi:hypothetical protein
VSASSPLRSSAPSCIGASPTEAASGPLGSSGDVSHPGGGDDVVECNAGCGDDNGSGSQPRAGNDGVDGRDASCGGSDDVDGRDARSRGSGDVDGRDATCRGSGDVDGRDATSGGSDGRAGRDAGCGGKDDADGREARCGSKDDVDGREAGCGGKDDADGREAGCGGNDDIAGREAGCGGNDDGARRDDGCCGNDDVDGREAGCGGKGDIAGCDSARRASRRGAEDPFEYVPDGLSRCQAASLTAPGSGCRAASPSGEGPSFAGLPDGPAAGACVEPDTERGMIAGDVRITGELVRAARSLGAPDVAPRGRACSIRTRAPIASRSRAYMSAVAWSTFALTRNGPFVSRA